MKTLQTMYEFFEGFEKINYEQPLGTVYMLFLRFT